MTQVTQTFRTRATFVFGAHGNDGRGRDDVAAEVVLTVPAIQRGSPRTINPESVRVA